MSSSLCLYKEEKTDKIIENMKIVIDVSGPEGNAFVLRGIARELGKALGYSKEKIDLFATKTP